MKNYDCIVIGGGASGMMASIMSARNGNKTLIIDHNEKLGKKLYITGKGKCNLTNNSSIENHLNNIMTNSKFMYSALNAFSPQDTMEFFEDNGLKLRTERGNRVFPASDKSSDVIKTLERAMHNYGVDVVLNSEIASVKKIDDTFHILCNANYEYTSSSLTIATGGLSYIGTGASDFGHKIATQFGHKIVPARSALCPIVLHDDVSELNGLALRNVALSYTNGKKNFSEFGDLLFTFNSITGPIALTMSSKINKLNIANTPIYIDLKPALTIEQLDNKLKREIIEYSKKDLKNYLATLLPKSFIDFFFARLNVGNKKMADLNKEDRVKLINLLKRFDLKIKSLDNVGVAIVTSGGVDIKEIDAKTCMSKIVPNLYFVGEVLDIDALTGGYNLQIAWSTGYLAGNNIGKKGT